MAIIKIRHFVGIYVIFALLGGCAVYYYSNWYDTPIRLGRRLYATELNSSHQPLVQTDSNDDTFNFCNYQNVKYKSWTKGVVSLLEPVVPRNCSLLFAGDKQEIERVQAATNATGELLIYSQNKESILNDLKDCYYVKNVFSNNFYTSQEEIDFPLAFVFIVHDNPQQVVRLLKAIYRSHNVYCIHVDRKASNFTKQCVESISECLHNVFIPNNVENVFWGHYSVLDAQMSCFSDLLDYSLKKDFTWKYVLPLSGKELPLRTNREIIHILKKLDGNTGIRLAAIPKVENFENQNQIVLNEVIGRVEVMPNSKLGSVPHNLTVYKSMTFSALTADFIDFLLHNTIAADFRAYLRNAISPEEKFYGTLFMMPGVPKGFNESILRHIPEFSKSIWLTPYAIGKLSDWRLHCNSRLNVHNICIVGIQDMFRLKYKVNVKKPKGPMFHNKYFMDVDHVVMDCCEEEQVKRNMDEFKRDYMTMCEQ